MLRVRGFLGEVGQFVLYVLELAGVGGFRRWGDGDRGVGRGSWGVGELGVGSGSWEWG